MRILVADSLPTVALDRLRAAGDQVTQAPELTADDLGDALTGVEVVVVRSTRVTAAALDCADRLALVVRAGAGTNTIDTARAAELGIYVCNVPGQNALAVAELTMGLLLAVDRHIAAATEDLRAGRWNKKAYAKADGLYGSTIGIIGLGDIGLATAERAAAFGIRVLAVTRPGRDADRLDRAERAGIEFVADREEMLSRSDIVSLHVPGGADTAGLVDAAFLAGMKDGAILLNTSRGDVVDEAALIEAMDERGLRAGLDVFVDEPASGAGEFASALARHPAVVATHHVGASTRQAQEAVADGAVDVIEAYRAGAVINCVNLADEPPRAATISVRHLDRVGVLAAVLAILRASDLNVSTMMNRVFEGQRAAVATIDVGAVPPDAILDQIRAHEHVINVSSSTA